MGDPLNADARPARLPLSVHIAVIVLITLSFVSGVALWYLDGTESNGPTDALHAWRRFHGALNPLMCVLFGCLLCQHIRAGWQIKANRVSGLLMETIFTVLIVSAVGIYYAPDAWQTSLIWVHRLSGVALPAAMVLHWVSAHFWVKSLEK
jgi:hypothetical protein